MEPVLLTLNDSERQSCEVWTRVMGYHRPVSAFNPGKLQEHNERLHFEKGIDAVSEVECQQVAAVQ